jgi:predicted RNA-binding Zn ribbon-like protein
VNADAELVVAFLNTLDIGTGDDELGGDDTWAAWATRHALPPVGPLTEARAVRAALRAAAVDGGSGRPADVAVPVAAGVIGGRPATVAPDATGAVLLAAARLAAADTWPRVKLCAAETCRWAFLDESRNRSRAWCSMDVCGNRAKARAFRARNHRP